MRVTYDEDECYELVQEVTIADMLKEHRMELADSVRDPIVEEWNGSIESGVSLLPVTGCTGMVTVSKFQSLVGSLLWIARCTWPGIVFAVHKALRRTHSPTTPDWKLATRIVRYLAGTRSLRQRMRGSREPGKPLEVIAYSDAGFAVDKEDSNSVTGGCVTVDGMAPS
ncbi:hypothetical protein PC129_g21378 [Phytophthora cactorum]|uniref:Reverse transcriptase Ty1/copia-type domain-containing protein n=1 Tax=Phytophthora cactorum TaxID=29920 RepID=A0A329RGT5_9STRA|nr:hypothetical protein Pcac1_g24808 [Phytophthora cactorum]KAG2804190.1 hypothetical protein PC112_g18827 [Phytophthora cactorum]KAG2805001.1 hypothetical protein PC111_g18010 [Phytophthora cactorum]KAG2841969.1 hypothetical protein PC113_g18918 [Phytophthora cactorum]KAG2883135.1 hypothetical protein PC114_g20710 [Phytophthora cactorum]